MALYQAILAYDGSGFVGFQRQAQGRTVQGEVEKALRRLGWSERAILYAGRTDSGVHAHGQVIAFHLGWRHSPEALQRALNAHLPADVAVQALRPAPADFHPRYAAVARRYVYYLYAAPVREPFWRRYAWRVWPAPAPEKLHQAAALFPGRKDFAALGTPPNPRGTTVRTVYRAAWAPLGPSAWAFDVVADAFLYRMVRRMVALQVAVARGRLAFAALQAALESPPANPLQGLAPPQGLFLEAVYYDAADLQHALAAIPPWLGGTP
jgi:tRNA pseudouridine38-40 synthase